MPSQNAAKYHTYALPSTAVSRAPPYTVPNTVPHVASSMPPDLEECIHDQVRASIRPRLKERLWRSVHKDLLEVWHARVFRRQQQKLAHAYETRVASDPIAPIWALLEAELTLMGVYGKADREDDDEYIPPPCALTDVFSC